MAKESSGWHQKKHKEHYSRDYRNNRKIIIIRDPICLYCWFVEGIITPTQEVDHYIPISKGGTHDLNNLQGICKNHHLMKTYYEKSGNIGFPEQIDPKTGWPKELPDFQSIIQNRHKEWMSNRSN